MIRVASAGLIGAALLLLAPTATADAAVEPVITITATTTCDSAASERVITWSITSNQAIDGRLSKATLGSPAATVSGLPGGSIVPKNGGALIGTTRMPGYGSLTSLQVLVVFGSKQVSQSTLGGVVPGTAACGSAQPPTVSFTSRCDGWLAIGLNNLSRSGSLRTLVDIFDYNGIAYDSAWVIPGDQVTVYEPPSRRGTTYVKTWQTALGQGAWQQAADCPTGPVGPSQPDRLKFGESLTKDARINSPDGRYTLVMQGDGNVVLYEYGFRALWASGMRAGSTVLTNQPDGNIVQYKADGQSYGGWSSGSYGQGPATLVLQNDGNAVLYRDRDNAPVWSTGTCCHGTPPAGPAAPTDKLAAGQALVPGGAVLTSPNGVYTLKLQSLDGNLVLYKNGTTPLWAWGARPVSWFTNQTDGNLVGYRSESGVAWASNTYGKGPATLTLQDDGNLVLYHNNDHAAVWSTGTYGR
jgi:hypothetical protein